jgi:hypothetical protein
MLQKSGSNLLVGRVLCKVDRDQELLGFRIDIADIDTAFVGEENPIALAPRLSASSMCQGVGVGLRDIGSVGRAGPHHNAV